MAGIDGIPSPLTLLHEAMQANKPCFNVHGVLPTDPSFVADTEEVASYWLLNEARMLRRYKSLKSGQRMDEEEVRSRRGRVATTHPLPLNLGDRASGPDYRFPAQDRAAAVLNRLVAPQRHEMDAPVHAFLCTSNTSMLPRPQKLLHVYDLSLFLLHPHVKTIGHLQSAGTHPIDIDHEAPQLAQLTTTLAKVLTKHPQKAGEVMTHMMTTPSSISSQMVGCSPMLLMMEMARYTALYVELDSVAVIAPRSPVTVCETATSTFRPLNVTLTAEVTVPMYTGSDVPWFCGVGDALKSSKTASARTTPSFVASSLPFQSRVRQWVQPLVDEIAAGVTDLLTNQVQTIVLDNRLTVLPVTAIVLLEPRYCPPVELLTTMGINSMRTGDVSAAIHSLRANRMCTYHVALRLVWPGLVAANLHLHDCVNPVLVDIMRRYSDSTEAGAYQKEDTRLQKLQLSVDCSNQGTLYGSSAFNGHTGPLLCRRIFCNGVWETDLSSCLEGTLWMTPPFGVAHCVPQDDNVLNKVMDKFGQQKSTTHAAAHMLLTWLCSVQPWGRPTVHLLPHPGRPDTVVRGAGINHTIFPSVSQVSEMMLRDNNVTTPMDSPETRVKSVIDILNGISPRRAREWTELLEVANLTHMMTYGTAEGMCVFIDWVLAHRKDAGQISEELLMNIWRHCGTHRTGHDTCSLDTLLMKKQFTETSTMAAAMGSNKITGAGTVTPHTTAFNTLYGMLRLDNPKRAHEFVHRESIRANATSFITKPGSAPMGTSRQRMIIDQFGNKPTEHTVAMWLYIRMRDIVVNSAGDTWIFKSSGCHRWVSDRLGFQMRKIGLGFLFQEYSKAIAERVQRLSELTQQAQEAGETLRRTAADEEGAAAPASRARGGSIFARGSGGRGRPGRSSAGMCLAQVQARMQRASGVEDCTLPPELLTDAANMDETEESLSGLTHIVFNKSGLCNVINVFMSFVCDPDFTSRLDQSSMMPFNNGVLSMRENQLRPGRPSDYCARGVWYAYYDHNKHDNDVRMYEIVVSRMFRYMDVIEQGSLHIAMQMNVYNVEKMLTEISGPTNAAKSSFISTNGFALGEKQGTLPAAQFMVSHREQDPSGHSTSLISSQGTAVVISNEAHHGSDKYDGGKIKLLTGRDRLMLRQMYKEPEELVPTWRPWIVCNTPPDLAVLEHAVIARMWKLLFRSMFTDSSMCSDDPAVQFRTGVFPGMVFTATDYQNLGSVHITHACTKYWMNGMGRPSFRPERNRRSILESMSYMSDATGLRSWLACFTFPRCLLGVVSRVGDKMLSLAQAHIEQRCREWQAEQALTTTQSDAGSSSAMGLQPGSPRWRARVSVYTLFHVMWFHSGWHGGISSPDSAHDAVTQQQMSPPAWLHALPRVPHPWLPFAVNKWIQFQTMSHLTSQTATHPLDSLCEHVLQQLSVPGASGARVAENRGFGLLPVEEICNKYNHFRRFLLMPGSQADESTEAPPPAAPLAGDAPPRDAPPRGNGAGVARAFREQHYGDGNSQIFGLDPSMFRSVVESNVGRQIVDGTLKSATVIDFNLRDPVAARRDKVVKAVRQSKRAIGITIDTMTVRYMIQHGGAPPLHIDAFSATVMNRMMMTGRTEAALKRMRDAGGAGQLPHTKRTARPHEVPALAACEEREVVAPADHPTVPWKRPFLIFAVDASGDEASAYDTSPVASGPSGAFAAAPTPSLHNWEVANTPLSAEITQLANTAKATFRVGNADTGCNSFSAQSALDFDENTENRKIMATSVAENWSEAESNYSRMHMARLNEMNVTDEKNTITRVPYGFTGIGKFNTVNQRDITIEPAVRETMQQAKQHIESHSGTEDLLAMAIGNDDPEAAGVAVNEFLAPYQQLLANQEPLQMHFAATSVSQIRLPDDTRRVGGTCELAQSDDGISFQNSGEAFRWMSCGTTMAYVDELHKPVVVREMIADCPGKLGEMLAFGDQTGRADGAALDRLIELSWENIGLLVA